VSSSAAAAATMAGKDGSGAEPKIRKKKTGLGIAPYAHRCQVRSTQELGWTSRFQIFSPDFFCGNRANGPRD
jgi:hypothetical protein